MPQGIIMQANGRYSVQILRSQTRHLVQNNAIAPFVVGNIIQFDVNPLNNEAHNLRARVSQYLLAGRNPTGLNEIVLGVKRTHFAGGARTIFAGGMPAVFGGRMDDGETAQDTVVRELREEIGYDLQNPPAFTFLYQETLPNQTETYRFCTLPNCIPNNFAMGGQTDEMNRVFTLTLDALLAGDDDANALHRDAMMREICAVAVIALPPLVLNAQQQQFLDSATLTALMRLVRQHRARRYQEGWDQAQAGHASLHPLQASYQAGYTQYQAGRDDAEQGLAAQQPLQTAYMAGHNQYEAGRNDAQQGLVTQHPLQAAYQAAFTQYQTGRDNAWLNVAATPAQLLQNAYMAGHNQYNAGRNDAQHGLAAQQLLQNAYMAGHNEHVVVPAPVPVPVGGDEELEHRDKKRKTGV